MMGTSDKLKLIIPSKVNSSDTLEYVINLLEIATPGEIMASVKLNEAIEQNDIAIAKGKFTSIIEKTKSNIEKFKKGEFGKELIQRSSGLKYVIHEKGNGKRPVMRQKVKAHYAGFLMDGSNFDNSFESGKPLEFPIGVNRVIAGWEEGIPMLDEGSKATLFVPYKLAYGEAGSPPKIPEKADLVFYIEIINIK